MLIFFSSSSSWDEDFVGIGHVDASSEFMGIILWMVLVEFFVQYFLYRSPAQAKSAPNTKNIQDKSQPKIGTTKIIPPVNIKYQKFWQTLSITRHSCYAPGQWFTMMSGVENVDQNQKQSYKKCHSSRNYFDGNNKTYPGYADKESGGHVVVYDIISNMPFLCELKSSMRIVVEITCPSGFPEWYKVLN